MNDFCLMPTKGSYSESLRYRTYTFEATDGVIKTKSMLTEPIMLCNYSALAFKTEKNRQFLNGFMEGLSFVVKHPKWGRAAVVTANTTGTTIYCDTTNSDFVVGDEVFIMEKYDTYSMAIITEVNVDNIVVDSSVTVNKNGFILPSFLAIVSGDVESVATGENYALCKINVEEFR